MTLPLLDLPLQDFYYEPDPSRSTLVNGDFEGAAGPPPAGWTAGGGSVLSRQLGTRPGGSGTYVGRATQSGASNYFGLLQNSMIVGAPYTMSGWCLLSESTAGFFPYLTDLSGGSYWVGTNSANWQNFNVVSTAKNVNLALYATDTIITAGRWVAYDDVTLVPHIARTKNLGSLGGSCQLGDGLTPLMFPTFVGGGKRGVNTCEVGNNSRVLYHPTFPALGTTGTLYALVYFSPAAIAEALTHPVLMQGLAATYANGCMLVQNAATLRAYWGGAGGLISASLTPGLHSVAMTNDGALVRMYIDGALGGVPIAPSGPSINTSLSIGGEYLAAGFQGLRSSRIYDAKVYNYALSETQIRSLTQRSLARINLY